MLSASLLSSSSAAAAVVAGLHVGQTALAALHKGLQLALEGVVALGKGALVGGKDGRLALGAGGCSGGCGTRGRCTLLGSGTIAGRTGRACSLLGLGQRFFDGQIDAALLVDGDQLDGDGLSLFQIVEN